MQPMLQVISCIHRTFLHVTEYQCISKSRILLDFRLQFWALAFFRDSALHIPLSRAMMLTPIASGVDATQPGTPASVEIRERMASVIDRVSSSLRQSLSLDSSLQRATSSIQSLAAPGTERTFKCQICLGLERFADAFTVEPCEHLFCCDCLQVRHKMHGFAHLKGEANGIESSGTMVLVILVTNRERLCGALKARAR